MGGIYPGYTSGCYSPLFPLLRVLPGCYSPLFPLSLGVYPGVIHRYSLSLGVYPGVIPCYSPLLSYTRVLFSVILSPLLFPGWEERLMSGM